MGKILNILRLSNENGFMKDVFVLLSWSVVAQIISFGVSPILSRLFSPDDFGVFANFTSVVFILGIIVTGKLESAIVLPEKEEDSIYVVYSLLFLSVIISSLILLVSIVFDFYNIEFLGFNYEIFYLIPLYLLMYGVFQASYYFGNRNKKYKELGISKLVQAITVAGSSIILSYFLGYGLIYGFVIGLVLTSIYLVFVVFKDVTFNKFTLKVVGTSISNNINFIRYSTTSGVLNAFTNMGFPLLISFFFTPYYTGIYFLSIKIISMPFNLLFSSLSQVYFQESARLYKEQPSNIFKLTNEIQKKMIIFIVPFLIVMSVISPMLFEFVFGVNWIHAGELVKYYAVFILFRSLYSPISSITDILGMQRFMLFFNLSLVSLQVLSLFIFSKYTNFELSLMVSSIIGAMHFLVLNVYIRKILKML